MKLQTGTKKTILLFTDWYEPGFKAGGPIRSCVNFVRQMQNSYRIFVFTSDRDLGSPEPYENIRVNEWIATEGDVQLYYCSPENQNWQHIREQVKIIAPDFIYLNSMFSPKFTIYPLIINRMSKQKATLILSPRGMLKDSAVQFKSLKKSIFLKSLRGLGFHRNIHFHASDATELNDIHAHFGANVKATCIPNFPGSLPVGSPVPEKRVGELSMIFIGRIHPIKNLDYLLLALKEASSKIRLTIIGGMEDTQYWKECQEIIAHLPAAVSVHYAGELPNHELLPVISAHHIFALPTKGENFGHAIFEALAAGRPVLISDQTPWKGLEASKAGWDLPLGSPAIFGETIGKASVFDQEEYNGWCRSARQYIEEYMNSLNLKEAYLKLFS
jgi:glycosyltransferase involved in cell wall biosynthesis